MGRREGGVMIDRFEERIWLYTGKVWFEGGDDTGNFGGVGVESIWSNRPIAAQGRLDIDA